MVFRCKECGHLFEDGEQATWHETNGEYGGTPYEEPFSGCPVCKGDYEAVKSCKLCDNVIEYGENFCDECKIYYRRHFKNLMDKNYNSDERELINLIFDGEEL